MKNGKAPSPIGDAIHSPWDEKTGQGRVLMLRSVATDRRPHGKCKFPCLDGVRTDELGRRTFKFADDDAPHYRNLLSRTDITIEACSQDIAGSRPAILPAARMVRIHRAWYRSG